MSQETLTDTVEEQMKALAETLSERERRLLRAVLFAASDPLDRMLLKTPLSAEEEAVLARFSQ